MRPSHALTRLALTGFGGIAALACGLSDVFRSSGLEAVALTYVGTPVSDPQSATVVLPSETGDDLLQRLRLVLAGEYEVEQELARGGMAVVYRATEVGLGRVVALKVLPPDLGLTPRAVERFKREARMVAELDHPNIIPVFRVGQSGTILYIVMKFVEGLALDAILEAQGALPVHTVLYVLRGATRALAYAHERSEERRVGKSVDLGGRRVGK